MSDTGGIREQIRLILKEKASVDVAVPDEDLIESGVLDSLTFVELFVEIEARFGVEVDLAALELDDLRSLDNIVDYVVERQKVAEG